MTSRTRSRSTAARWSTPSSRTRASGRTRSRALAGARGVLVGSRHTAEQLWAEMDDPSLPWRRTRLGPPGVDVAQRFARAGAAARIWRAALRASSRWRGRPAAAASRPTRLLASHRDPREAVAALDSVEPGDRLIVFVGKLIASKGVELLLAAFPLVLAREPRARLVIVGFGAFRAGLERLAAQLAAGDLDAAARTARRRTGASCRSSRRSSTRLDPTPTAPRRRARRPRRVRRAGSTTPSSPTCCPPPRRWRSPSTFPEAFGMVAAEAAACGALPVVANHSGLGEVARTLREAVPEAARGWLSFEVGPTTRWSSSRTRSRAGSTAPEDLRAAHPRGDRRGHPRAATRGTASRARSSPRHRATSDDLPNASDVPGRGRQRDRRDATREDRHRGRERERERQQAGRDRPPSPRRGRSACRRRR